MGRSSAHRSRKESHEIHFYWQRSLELEFPKKKSSDPPVCSSPRPSEEMTFINYSVFHKPRKYTANPEHEKQSGVYWLILFLRQLDQFRSVPTYNFKAFLKVRHLPEQMVPFRQNQRTPIDMGVNTFQQLCISLMQNVTQHVNVWPPACFPYLHLSPTLCLFFPLSLPASNFRNFPQRAEVNVKGFQFASLLQAPDQKLILLSTFSRCITE